MAFCPFPYSNISSVLLSYQKRNNPKIRIDLHTEKETECHK